MYKKLQRIEVEITDVAEKNQCFGQLSDGMAVFVQGAVAVGDLVEAQIYKIKKNYLHAKLTQVITPSTHRTSPVCPHFGTCGGCKWQHMDYTEQLRLKQKQVTDALKHIGGFEHFHVEPIIPAKATYAYRNKVDLSFTDLRYLTEKELTQEPHELNKPIDFALGFHAPGRYAKAIDIDHCYIATEATNTAIQLVRSFALTHKDVLPPYSTKTHEGELRNLVIRHGGNSDQIMVHLITSTHQPVLMEELSQLLQKQLGARLCSFINSTTTAKNTAAYGEKSYLIYGKETIEDTLKNYTYQISAAAFFQTNTAQAECLYDLILEVAELSASDVVYDLFCGTGSIALYAARHCKKVIGIELIQSAVDDAQANATRNQIRNTSFRQLDMKHLGQISDQLSSEGVADVIITDPPRAGMHPKAVDVLRELHAPIVIYVSCNPASLARDGAMLCEGGRYRLVSVQAVDLFPQTQHVESVARFERV